jgi:hypothetical protein
LISIGAATAEATTNIKQNNPTTIPNNIFFFSMPVPPLLNSSPVNSCSKWIATALPRNDGERLVATPSKAGNLNLVKTDTF